MAERRKLFEVFFFTVVGEGGVRKNVQSRGREED
jgi:hypothetical protein